VETGERTSMGFGNGAKLYQQRALEALPLLVRQAKAGATIFYSDLGTAMKMPNARNLNFVLGAVGGELEQLSRRWNRGQIPPLQFLVINRQDGTPGNGIGWFVPGEFKKLPPPEKRRVVAKMLTEVFSYPLWDAVLKEYDLAPAEIISGSSLNEEALIAVARYGRNGEGDDHRTMKEFIAAHPALFGLPAKLKGETEHPFPSADCLDVLFRNESEWVGVEVKGPGSDDLDINRGLFQCVKYQALLEAEQKLLQQGVNSRMVLAICRSLSEDLNQRRLVLNVSVQHVRFPES
jgi:hypothetical protein